MKKRTLVSMITGALVIGAASTTFAAANPFSDVPADSWAYDAVSKLASDGVVNGYPDGSYQGQGTMTRYEMAQIVAKAMTKTDIDKADKALVDKLAAEFSEELDNLGVRVADLEKKSDNVKWTGRLKYAYNGVKYEHGDRQNENHYEFRLEPKAFIGNSGWTANARIRYFSDANKADGDDADNSNNSDTKVDRIYVEGNLLGATADLGKFPLYTDNALGSGMILDDSVSGGAFTWKLGQNKNTYITAGVGRYDFDKDANFNRETNFDGTADVGVFEVGHNPAGDKGLSYVAGYYSLRNINRDTTRYDVSVDGDNHVVVDSYSDKAKLSSYQKDNGENSNIWSAGLGYRFDKNFNFYGIYAKSNLDSYAGYQGDDQDKAYDITLQYKGADQTKAGSWGLWAAYRYLGEFATVDPTYDAATRGYKGFEVGTQWTVAENILLSLEYFKGKDLGEDFGGNDADFNKIYGSVEFFF